MGPLVHLGKELDSSSKSILICFPVTVEWTQFWPRRLEGNSTGGRERTSGKVMLVFKKGNSLF